LNLNINNGKSMLKKIAIIGYGAATIGFLVGLFERN